MRARPDAHRGVIHATLTPDIKGNTVCVGYLCTVMAKRPGPRLLAPTSWHPLAFGEDSQNLYPYFRLTLGLAKKVYDMI